MTRVLSASQITSYLACPRRYAFRYVENVPPEHQSSALSFGSAAHSALEWFHTERLADRSPEAAEVVSIFRADWHAEAEKPLRFKEGETHAGLLDLGSDLVAQYVARYHAIEIVEAEVAFEVDLVDRETGETFDLRLRGYFDLVLRDDQLVEVKTSARRYDRDTLRRHVQLSAYAYAYRERSGRDPTVTVIQLLKLKKPAIEVAGATRTREDDAFFVHLARAVADGIESRVFPPSPGYLCGDCEYAKSCTAWRGSSDTDPPIVLPFRDDTGFDD